MLHDMYTTFDEYDEHAHRTVASPCASGPHWFTHLQAKLTGEAGEFSEHFGKALRDDVGFDPARPETLTPERRQALLKELGDILWYVAVLARLLGSSLWGIAVMNVVKREGRAQRGTLQGAGDDR